MTLEVTDLTVRIGDSLLLDSVSFTLASGERLGLIGGSGSGKTLTALAVAGLLPAEATVSGRVLLDGVDLLKLSGRELAAVRGDRVGMVFQEPKTALNPLHRLGRQMTEALHVHYHLSREERRAAAQRLAAQVGLADTGRLLRSYPHQVSGGQRQRAAIAAAIATSPAVLIADEPTTALDVTVQRGILDLFVSLSESAGQSLLFISHDLAVVAEVADRVLVLDSGRVVEQGSVQELLDRPQHASTRALITAAADASWRKKEKP